MIIFGGGAGSCGSFSMISLRGGGGRFLPGIVMVLEGNGAGARGGSSRIMIGSGCRGRGASWRMTSGGAAGAWLSLSCWMMMSPAGGGLGGLRSLYWISWCWTTLSWIRLRICGK